VSVAIGRQEKAATSHFGRAPTPSINLPKTLAPPLSHLQLCANACWTWQAGCSSVLIVPNATKTAGPDHAARAGNLPFEDALKKLEVIVEAMESEDLPLETLLARYEEGTRLARICQEKLAEAELKIQQLEKNAAGEIKLKPMPLPENPGE
jgi:exodeoxyribonuclease VII small subunit